MSFLMSCSCMQACKIEGIRFLPFAGFFYRFPAVPAFWPQQTAVFGCMAYHHGGTPASLHLERFFSHKVMHGTFHTSAKQLTTLSICQLLRRERWSNSKGIRKHNYSQSRKG